MASAKLCQNYRAERLIERQMRLRDLREHAGIESPALESLPAIRFITISRDIGSGGEAVALELQRLLGWHV